MSNDPAEVLLLAGAALSAQDIEPCLQAAGHVLIAAVSSLDEVRGVLAARSARPDRPDREPSAWPAVLLVDAEQVRTPLAAAGIAEFGRELDVPVVYVASEISALEQLERLGDRERIVCLASPRELSLAIQLVSWRWRSTHHTYQAHQAHQAAQPPQAVPEHDHVGEDTEVRLAREALLLYERWQHLMTSMPVVLYSARASDDHGITFASENVAALLGYRAAELVSAPRFWIEHLHPDDAPRVLAAMPAPTGGLCASEYRLRHRDGSYRWVLDSRRLLPGGGGEGEPLELEIVGSWMDITERRSAEEALKASETRFKAIVEDQTELICRYLPDGVLTFVNEAYCRYFDKRPEDLLGKSFVPLIPEEDQGVAAAMFAALSPDNPVGSAEHRVILDNGEVRWQSWTDRVIVDEAGRILEYQAVGRDVTKRKQAEEALRQSEARYSVMFQMATIPLWEEDVSELQRALAALEAQGVSDFRQYLDDPARTLELASKIALVAVNDRVLELLGVTSQEELERSFDRIMLPESVPFMRETILALAEGKSHFQGENTLGTLRGERITVLCRIAFPAPERGLRNMLVSSVDITERKRAEEKIKQLNVNLSRRAAELQAANAELEAFSYSVSHDLRAPLRAIDGFSKALYEDYATQLDDQGRSYLTRVRNASQRMAQLIDDLLGLSRMARGSLNIEICDLSALAHGIVHELSRRTPGREVEVVIAPGLQVQADCSLLRVALENLIGNAWKFTSRKPHARIEIGATQRDGRTAYFVRDNGAGFDMAFVGKLFGAFQRLHGMHEFEGTGIGLATVQRIIRRHGGEVWAEGKVDEGATFTFTLS